MMFPGTESNLILNFDKFVNEIAVKLLQSHGTEVYSKNLIKAFIAQYSDLTQGKISCLININYALIIYFLKLFQIQKM